MVFDDIIKSKLDLEIVLTFLSEVLEKEKVNEQKASNYKSPVGKSLWEDNVKRCSVLTQCKENLEYGLKVLEDYINAKQIQSNAIYSYKPRKLSLHSEIGKYRTEVLRAKKTFEFMLWTTNISREEEKKALCQECIDKMNYVYSNITKRFMV